MRYRIEFLWDPDVRTGGADETVSFPSEQEDRRWWLQLPAGTVPGSAFARPEEEGT